MSASLLLAALTVVSLIAFSHSAPIYYGRGGNGNRQTIPNSVTGTAAISSFTPFSSPELQDLSISHISTSIHTIIITTNGEAYAYGRKDSGELGIENTDPSIVYLDTPTKVTELKHTCLVFADTPREATVFLDSAGEVYVTGNNKNGRLCHPTQNLLIQTPQKIPVKGSMTGKRIKSISCSEFFCIFLAQDGTVHGCGDNTHKQLSSDAVSSVYVPVQLRGDLLGKKIVQVSSGLNHVAFLDDKGRVYVSGSNSNSQHGHMGTFDNPNRVTSGVLSGFNPPRIKEIAATGDSTLVLGIDGVVYGFGGNTHGELGIGTANNPVQTPTEVSITPIVKSIRSTYSFSGSAQSSIFFLLDVSGKVYAAGRNAQDAIFDALVIYQETFVAYDDIRAREVIPGIQNVILLGCEVDESNPITCQEDTKTKWLKTTQCKIPSCKPGTCCTKLLEKNYL